MSRELLGARRSMSRDPAGLEPVGLSDNESRELLDALRVETTANTLHFVNYVAKGGRESCSALYESRPATEPPRAHQAQMLRELLGAL